MVFNEDIEYPKRDWETFKNCGYRDHQLIVSPLVEINTDVINLFPLDYMHLACLGAVRRILNFLKKDLAENYQLIILMKFQCYSVH